MSRHCERCDATTDLLTFTLKDVEDNKIDNNPLAEIKPSDFTDKLKDEQLPNGGETTPDNDNSGGSLINSVPAEKGSALDKIISGLPSGIRQLEKVFAAAFFVLIELILLL